MKYLLSSTPYGHERISLITSRGYGDFFFFTKQDGGRRRGEGLREALLRDSCDSCDSCDSFQGRGI
jgi:hypothetical protein